MESPNKENKEKYKEIFKKWQINLKENDGKIYHDNSNQKKSGVATLISENVDFRINITSNIESHFMMIKGSIHEEVLIILIIYAFNSRDSSKNWQTWKNCKEK